MSNDTAGSAAAFSKTVAPGKEELNKRKIGGRFEQAACIYLQQKGFRLREANFRIRSGEIDLIMDDEETLVFIEVKYRSTGNCGRGEEHVDRRKQQKIIKVAEYYLLREGLCERCPCRFDVVSVDGAGNITHYENAFGLP